MEVNWTLIDHFSLQKSQKWPYLKIPICSSVNHPTPTHPTYPLHMPTSTHQQTVSYNTRPQLKLACCRFTGIPIKKATSKTYLLYWYNVIIRLIFFSRHYFGLVQWRLPSTLQEFHNITGTVRLSGWQYIGFSSRIRE